MFCPNCGSEERQRGRFCRVYGTDLCSVRLALEKPDVITASAAESSVQPEKGFERCSHQNPPSPFSECSLSA
jgi:hypothetical protein